MSTATAEPPPVTLNREPIREWREYQARHERREQLWPPEQELEMRAAQVSPEIVAWIEQRARQAQHREVLERNYQQAQVSYAVALRTLEEATHALQRDQRAELHQAEENYRRALHASFGACCAPERGALEQDPRAADCAAVLAAIQRFAPSRP